jgi:hypothetical protein
MNSRMVAIIFVALLGMSGVYAACFEGVNSLPATCQGGTIEEDLQGACRTITCISGTSGFRVEACDKPAFTTKSYFELYSQVKMGSQPLTICIDYLCLSSEQSRGFSRSASFCGYHRGGAASEAIPESADDLQEVVNEETTPIENMPVVSLGIGEWYPQGRDYLFVCDANFAAESYDWNFGDGEQLIDVQNANVLHTYADAGSYSVYCAASGQATADDVLSIDVE